MISSRFSLLRRVWQTAPILALVLVLTAPARADRWFGSIAAGCDSFAFCSASPEMPEQPANSATPYLRRDRQANAPLEIFIHVNKPVESGVPVRLEFGQTAIELAASDLQTRRVKEDGAERLAGYWIADNRVPDILAAMRKVDTARIKIPVEGQTQDLLMLIDGLDAALRHFDERQGRTGARDALVAKGERAAADAPVPKPLPAIDAWPTEIARIYRREKCEDNIATFEGLKTGLIATPAPGRELWQIPCAGGNYTILFIYVEVRNGDPRTARHVTLPTRVATRRSSVIANPVWWETPKEIWAFERGRAHGDCGTVTRFRWSGNGLTLVDQRSKEDCDGRFEDPWTKWPVTKVGRRSKR